MVTSGDSISTALEFFNQLISTAAPSKSIAMRSAHLEKTFKDSEIPTCLPIVYAASLVAIRRTRLFRCIRTPSRSSHFTDHSSSVGVHTNSEYVLRPGFSLSPPPPRPGPTPISNHVNDHVVDRCPSSVGRRSFALQVGYVGYRQVEHIS